MEAPPAPLPHDNALPLRELTVELFEQIAFDDVTMDRALADHPQFRKINTLDRALVRMILTTTIRRLGQIDNIIKHAMNSDRAPEPRLLLSLLRVAVAQILFMNVPDHAAVNVSVNLAERMGLIRQKGLVNAVLRRVAREGGDITARQDIPRLNIPNWMLSDWIKHYGKRTGLEAATASLLEAPLDLSLKNNSDTAHWAKILNADILPTGSLRIIDHAGSIEHLNGFHDGAWWVQDAAAALPIHILGDIKGKRLIDLCAAPGGKTAQAASRGAHVIAIDRSAPRLEMMRRNLDRLGLTGSVEIIEADGTTYQTPEPADIVLIDAPCTATGTLRRNPDILLHRDEHDVARMNVYQEKLLTHALTLLKPGGMIVYAVCSLQHGEGEGMIAAFLETHREVTRVPITAEQVGGLSEIINANGEIRALPGHLKNLGSIDGFFTVVLRYLA